MAAIWTRKTSMTDGPNDCGARRSCRSYGLLLDRCTNVNHTGKYRVSAFVMTVIYSHTEIALAVVDVGADHSIRGNGPPGSPTRQHF